MSKFRRELSDDFIQQLTEEAKKGSWWADVLNDPKLFIAVRDQYLNVYWRGQSLFRVVLGASGLRATMHPKFLLDPELADQVSLAEREFDVRELVERGFVRRYEGPATLAKMKKAAGLFSGPEDTGCHDIILDNPQVIDREIAFSGIISLHDGGSDKKAHLVDLLSLEPGGTDVRLAFWEAKHFTNGELRALGAVVPVCEQIKRYRQCLSEHREEIEDSYKRVVENLVAISRMGWKRRLSPLINEVAGGRKLTLGTEPTVGLVIFGFDQPEKDDPNWQDHLGRLKKEITPLIARGHAKGLRLKS